MTFQLIDFAMAEQPKRISDDMKAFWGGSGVEFQLVTAAVHAEFGKDPDALRKRAINLGCGTRFKIDISGFKYVEETEPASLEGFTICVHSR